MIYLINNVKFMLVTYEDITEHYKNHPAFNLACNNLLYKIEHLFRQGDWSFERGPVPHLRRSGDNPFILALKEVLEHDLPP
jgi:hypothetical protein